METAFLYHETSTNAKTDITMNARPKTVFFLFLILFGWNFLAAQPQTVCSDFEDLPANERYGPEYGQQAGDVIFETNPLTWTLSPYYYGDSSSDLSVVFVYQDSSRLPDQGQVLFPSNANLTIAPTGESQYPSDICTEFFYWGGSLNLGVNHQRPLFFPDLQALLALNNSEIFPGIFLEIVIDETTANAFPVRGKLCLSGDLTALTLGGQEFAFDDLCWTPRSPDPCRWDEVHITTDSCTPNGIFYLNLEFPADWAETGGSFKVDVNGKRFGPYAYGDTTLKVGPVPLSSTGTYQVRVYDPNNPDCSWAGTVQPPCFDMPCPLTQLKAYIDNCSDPNNPEIVIDFAHDSLAPRPFSLLIEGLVNSSFTTDDLPLRLPLPPVLPIDLELTIKICLEVPGYSTPCCLEVMLTQKECEGNDQCIEFEELPPNAIFGDSLNPPGSVLFSEDMVPVGINRFISGDAAFFGKTWVTTDIFGGNFKKASGQYLFVSNTNLTFYLGRAQKPINQVCFDFFEGGGSLNLGVNGNQVVELRNFSDLRNLELPEGIKAEVYYDTTATTNVPRMGTVCLYGDIRQLTLGGQELGLDNVCFDHIPEEPCQITSFEVRPTACDANGEFFVYLHVEQAGQGSEGFAVYRANGQFLGSFSYDADSVKVGPFNAYSRDLLYLIVKDKKYEDCSAKVLVDKPTDCLSECSIGGLEVDVLACYEQLYYDLKIDLKHIPDHLAQDSFQLNIDGQEYGHYPYAALPLKLNQVPVFTEATTFPVEICARTTASDAPCCVLSRVEKPVDCRPLCGVEGLKVNILECYENVGAYELYVDVAHYDSSLANSSFLLTVEGQEIGTFDFAALPLKIDSVFVFTDALTFTVQLCPRNTDAEACCLSAVVHKKDCHNAPCRIGDLKIVDRKCDEDGRLYLGIDFEYKNVSDYFVLWQNGNEMGKYRYDQLPIEVGPYYTPIAAERIKLEVFDSESRDCSSGLLLPELTCDNEPCRIGDLHLKQTDCDSTGTYYVKLDFEYAGTSDSFLLVQNDVEVGIFNYAHLPLKLGPFSEPLPEGLEVKVKDLQNNNCYQAGYLDDLGCLDGSCTIYEAKVFDIECTPEGTYHLSLAYEADGLQDDDRLLVTFSSGYQVRFHAGENPVRLTNIPLPASGQDMLKLCGTNGLDCCYSIDYLIDCPNTCGLSNLRTKVSECNEEGRFDLKIDFDYENVSDGFTLFLNGRAYGNYAYADLPITAENLVGTAGKVYQVTVRDFRNFECKINTRIESPNCTGTCTLAGVKTEVSDCYEGQFKAVVYPDITDNREGAFVLFVGGEQYGPFRYGKERIEVGPLPADGQRYDVLLVDLADPTCFAHTNFFAPDDCSDPAPPCRIDDLTIKILECNDDGTYRVYIDFAHTYADNKYFDLYNQQGESIDYFRLDQLPLEVDLELDNEQATTVLGVCINDQEDCCARSEVIIPDCGADANCFLDRIKVSTTECDSNGQVYIILEAGLEAGSNLALEILLNDQVIDSIRFDLSNTIRLGPIQAEAGRDLFLVLASLTSNDCFREIALRVPDCDDDSDVWPGDANRDNIANYIDLINIGVGYGARGVARTQNRTEWTNIPGSSWSQFFANGLNYKHADCNGDGIIDARDVLVVINNYNKTNGAVLPPDTLPATDLDPAIRLDLPPGGHVGSADPRLNIPIVLGDAERPVEDIYALAFIIEFDPLKIDPTSVEVDILDSWLGIPGVNLTSIDYTDVQEGRIEIAISRTDQNEVSGYGPIAMLRGIKDDIAGLTTSIHMRHGRRSGLDMEEDGLGGGEFKVAFTDLDTDPNLTDLENSLRVFPNPTIDRVQVTTSYALPIETLQVLSLDGKRLSPIETDTDWISLAGLPQGIYILEIGLDGNILHQKVMKQ